MNQLKEAQTEWGSQLANFVPPCDIWDSSTVGLIGLGVILSVIIPSCHVWHHSSFRECDLPLHSRRKDMLALIRSDRLREQLV